MEGEHAETVVGLDDAGRIGQGRAQLECLGVAGLRGVEQAAVPLDVADVHERRGHRTLVAELPAHLESARRAVERLVVARHQPEHLPDVVQRAGDPTSVARLLEELEAALEVLERERQIALVTIDAPHLVERDGRLRARRHDPGEAQHALERTERRVVVALQMEHRPEVVPEVDPAGDIVGAEAAERGDVEADRLVVEVASTRGIGGAAIAHRGAFGLAGALEVAADLLLLLLAAPSRSELEPLRHEAVIATPSIIVEAGIDDVEPGRRREAELTLAGDAGLSL